MSKKNKGIKNYRESQSDFININKQLAFLRENKRKIQTDQEIYYNEQQDQFDQKKYYHSTKIIENSGLPLFYRIHSLLERTHKNRIPYFISKDLYLYTWVDLYPDGLVKSIYSGEKKDPVSLIIQDHDLIYKKYAEFQQILEKLHRKEYELFKQLKLFERKLKLNTEHIVPKSWFSGLEPMKGDLHHLFICEPECNIARSNFPFDDCSKKFQKSPDKSIQNNCGTTASGRFEPENGKGEASRAMLYFLVRYPRVIKKSYRTQIDLSILIQWHKEFPVTLYEKHRNQAIYQIQGNRNPFIDFSDLAERVEFPIS